MCVLNLTTYVKFSKGIYKNYEKGSEITACGDTVQMTTVTEASNIKNVKTQFTITSLQKLR